jgi:hypothetical protein
MDARCGSKPKIYAATQIRAELVAAQPIHPSRTQAHDHEASIAPGSSREQSAGSASKIIEIDPTSLRRGSEPRCQIQCLIDQGSLCRDGLLTHVTQDRRLGARRDDRIFDALDPYLGSVAIPSFLPEQRLQRVNAV